MATKTAERPATQAAPKEAPRDNLPAQQQPRQKPPIVQFREYVEQRMATLEDALPPTIPPKRFVSVVMTALQNKPKLLECTFPSLWNACVRAAQDGLLPDGREGAIAPYGENKDGKRTSEIATWMPMIEGYRKKIYETGKVRSWEVDVVYEKDEFEFERGDNAFIRHRPYMGVGSSGGVVGAYSIAKLASGEIVREVMTAFQIKQVADKSKAANGPWKDAAAFPEMCKKTVARRHYKQLPHSESMDAMIARDDADHGLADPEATPIARPAPARLSSRQAFDAYAGATVDNETGEVLDEQADDQSGDVNQSADTKPAATTPRKDATSAATTGGESKGAEAKTEPQREKASAPAQTAATSADGPEEVRTEAGRGATTTAPASTTTGQESQSADEADANIDEMPDEPETDGADRPWPPGAEPTNADEYFRHLTTKLAAMTKANEVAPWFNSDAEKALRKACQADTRFQEFQGLAISRRRELP